MYTLNPYAQAGWYNPQNQYSIDNDAWSPSNSSSNPPQPSIFGALPYSTPICSTTFLTFRFTSFQPDILTCHVLGLDNRSYCKVINDSPGPGVTVFRNMLSHDMRGFAIIDWRQPSAVVEVSDVVPRQPVNHWLLLSQDRRYVQPFYVLQGLFVFF